MSLIFKQIYFFKDLDDIIMKSYGIKFTFSIFSKSTGRIEARLEAFAGDIKNLLPIKKFITIRFVIAPQQAIPFQALVFLHFLLNFDQNFNYIECFLG